MAKNEINGKHGCIIIIIIMVISFLITQFVSEETLNSMDRIFGIIVINLALFFGILFFVKR
jgi:hypothetical protein